VAPSRIPDLISKRRVGRVLVSVVNTSRKDPLPTVLRRLGIRHQGGENSTELTADVARELLLTILTKGLAYNDDAMPLAAATELVDTTMSMMFPAGAKLVTNLAGGIDDLRSRSYSLLWVTDATFPVGVVAIGGRSAACLWVEDED
jgi:hypothetical protein